MSRLVIPSSSASARITTKAPPPADQGDQYKERLVKYIPAEAIAFYAFVDKAFVSYYGIDSAGQATAQAIDALFNFLPGIFIVVGLIGINECFVGGTKQV